MVALSIGSVLVHGRSSLYFRSALVHGRTLAALSISQRSRTQSQSGSSLYSAALSYTVAIWQLSLFRSALVHGRTLTALSISQCSRTRSYFGSSLFSQRSRTRSRFGSSPYQPTPCLVTICTASAVQIVTKQSSWCCRTRPRFGSSLNWRLSYTVALWQLSLFRSVLVHDRPLAALSIGSILVHGRVLAALSISQRSRKLATLFLTSAIRVSIYHHATEEVA